MRGRIDPHARYRELIAARLDKPLTRVELRALNAHLKKCMGCEQLDDEYRAERNLLRGLTPPIPPRDLWARTSASLDREVARAYRAEKWRRRVARGRRSTQQPSTTLMTGIAALGVTAALVVLQLAPAIGPAASVASRPTPVAIPPQQFAFLGVGRSDVAVYRTEVSQVCPASAPPDCVETEKYVRTPVGLPPDVRAGNVSLSPSGNQLAVVGHKTGEDVIAVVMMPPDSNDSSNGGKSGNGGDGDTDHTKGAGSGSGGGAQAGGAPGAVGGSRSQTAGDNNPDQTTDPGAQPSSVAVGDPGDPTAPPASAVPGLAVLAILDNVQSAGAPPDWSPNGEILAFSAMPDDSSRGPDVYIWSPGDAKASAITSDHDSYFASWSGNRIVVSRITGSGSRPHNFVVDPRTLEERAVGGPQLWLPSVNAQRTQAIGWFGQLDTSAMLPALRSGALYMMDWATVDPFGAAAPTQASGPADQPDPAAQPDEPEAGQATDTEHASPALDASTAPDATDGPTDGTKPQAPDATAKPADNAGPGSGLDALVPLEPDRDPRAAPVVDWQARWSTDGDVLGIWIADSAGSTWGRLAVLAVDPDTNLVTNDNPLLSMTLAQRGFSLGTNRVAWVGPSDDNIDGELRIRTWGSDGVGGLRLKAPDQEEVVPAS